LGKQEDEMTKILTKEERDEYMAFLMSTDPKETVYSLDDAGVSVSAHMDAQDEKIAALKAENERLRGALLSAHEWAERLKHDERVAGWVHAHDYSLYLTIADHPIEDPLLATPKEEKKG
jgi:hypothetical protein